jgi:hypothetical protein
MRKLSMGIKNGPTKEIQLQQGDSHFLIIKVIDEDSGRSMDAWFTNQEAEWLLKLLDMHVQERGFDD